MHSPKSPRLIGLTFAFSLLTLVVGYWAFGLLTMLVFTSGFLGGWLLWLLLPSRGS